MLCTLHIMHAKFFLVTVTLADIIHCLALGECRFFEYDLKQTCGVDADKLDTVDESFYNRIIFRSPFSFRIREIQMKIRVFESICDQNTCRSNFPVQSKFLKHYCEFQLLQRIKPINNLIFFLIFTLATDVRSRTVL